MSFQDTLKKALSDDLYGQVVDALGDDFDFEFVPRSRLNQVIRQRNDLRKELELQLQGNPGQPASPQQEPTEPPVDIEALKAQWQQEQDQAVQTVKLQYATLEKLRSANTIDPELILQAGLIDLTKLTMGADGSVAGLDEIITDISQSKPHLFQKPPSGKEGVPGGTGKSGGEGGTPPAVATKADFLKLPLTEQLAFKQANPETFKTFLDS